MGLFFEVYLFLKNDFWLWRIVKMSIAKGIEIKIFSDNDLIVIEKGELNQVEITYLLAARHLIEWALRNENHAKSSTRKGAKKDWINELKEKLDVADIADRLE